MPIGDPMTSTIPAVGTSGTGYATAINAFLTEVKALLEANIPMASLLIDTLDMENNAIDNVQYLSLYEQEDPPADIGTLANYGGDLYWVNAAGAVQITLDGALNSAAIAGITGDYGGANPAQWRFDDADQAFYGYDDYSGAKWAHVRARDFGMYGAYGGTTRITLTGTANPSSYTITLPDAPPGAQAMLQMSSAGAVSASNTIAQPITATDFLFSGTRVKAFSPAHASSSIAIDTTQNYIAHGTSTNRIFFDLNLESDDVITAWKVYINKTSASGTVTAALYKQNISTGVEIQVGNADTDDSNNPGMITLTDLTMTPETVVSEYSYYVKITPSGTTGDFTRGCSVNYDRTA